MQKYYFNIIIKYSLSLSFLIGLTSCNAIFEKDISEDTLDLILPTNGQSYSTNKVHFKWTELDGASNYKIEIVQPSYANIQEFILDTLVEGGEYYYILEPGNYEFQIRAENSGYQTAFVGPYSISIDSVTDLSSQLVQLTSPANLFYINSLDVVCSWQPHYAADTYEFQLRNGLDFNNSASIPHVMTDIYTTTYTIPQSFLSEGEFSWGVRAINQNSSSNFSSNGFTIDLTAPNDVTLTSPADNFNSTSQTVVFKWSTGTDPGTVNSPVNSVIELSNDVNFTSILYTQNNIISDSLEYTFSNAGDYWWRVYAEDEAGNISVNYSLEYKVTVP